MDAKDERVYELLSVMPSLLEDFKDDVIRSKKGGVGASRKLGVPRGQEMFFVIIVFKSVNSSLDDDTQSFNLSIIRCHPIVVSDGDSLMLYIISTYLSSIFYQTSFSPSSHHTRVVIFQACQVSVEFDSLRRIVHSQDENLHFSSHPLFYS